MRRADRLFEIVQYLRGRRLTTVNNWPRGWRYRAHRLSDIAIARHGVPIDGEAGVGYRLHASFDLPPLMFNFDEVEALDRRRAHGAELEQPATTAAGRIGIGENRAAIAEDKRARGNRRRICT